MTPRASEGGAPSPIVRALRALVASCSTRCAAVACVVSAGLACAAVSPVHAGGEVVDLEEGLPLEVTDAYPTAYRGRELQLVTRYERGDGGVDQVLLEPRIEVGFPRNTQLSVAGPFLFGEGVDDGPGRARVELLYNLNQEALALPAFSVAGGTDFPTQDDSHGVDPFVKLLVTKTVPGTWHLHRLHFNALYQFNDEVQSDERDGRYKVIAGYSTVVTNEIVFMADLVREEDVEEHVERNLAEVGMRLQASPRTILAFGFGSGFGDESPEIRTTAGLQVNF